MIKNEIDLQIIKEDYDNDWWKASAIDNYDLNKKLMRVGCRPIHRKLFRCETKYILGENKSKCNKLNEEFKKCYDALYSIYLTNKKDNFILN